MECSQGVPGEIGYFLVGNEATASVAISNGMFCLIGTGTATFYRYNVSGGGSNSLGQFDGVGVLQNLVGTSTVGSGFDVPGTIPGSVPITITSGDTWHFQAWYRDSPAAQGTSNFSNGLSVTFPTVGPTVPIAGMVQIPAGTFSMGSNAASGAPYYGQSNERPVHSVTISQSFWMSETEITQAQYQAIMGLNPSFYSGANFPVEQVTWHNARAYCAALTAQEQAAGNVPVGMEYRLPAEAEWEYACRAGTTTEFNVGASLFCGQACFLFSLHSNSGCNSSGTVSVGSYSANAFGLYDMHGNVNEWCLDSYAAYSPVSQTDPFVTGGPNRVIRSGFWSSSSNGCRSAYRISHNPGVSFASLGFRVVLAPVLVP
ncbi:MAG: formylglycine-generating enzyme family protein [bacterium]|nr:formylglycine-generating enzyme family protein [bacterium]